MRRGITTLGILIVAIGIFFWWPQSPAEIVPADPNPFVESVTISPIELKVDDQRGDTIHATPLPLVNGQDTTPPFADTIELPLSAGQYVLIDLERFETTPNTLGGRDVNTPNRWPITFTIYPLGDPDGESAREFLCQAADGTIGLPEFNEATQQPPPMLPVIGRMHGGRSDGFVGIPDIGLAPEGHNRYWTFLVLPVAEESREEYVYEVRLYPTARWISAVRWEVGDSIVLRRGKLVAIDRTEFVVATSEERTGN